MRPYHTRWGRGEVEREERGGGEKEVIKATGAGGGASTCQSSSRLLRLQEDMWTKGQEASLLTTPQPH